MKPKILVGTSDGLHVAGEPRSVEFAGREVRSLVWTDAESWAIVDKREVWRNADKEGWQKMATTSEGAALCLLPTETGIFVGGAGAHLFRLRGGTLESVPSFDHVKDRDGWSNPAGAEPDVRSMSASSTSTCMLVELLVLPTPELLGILRFGCKRTSIRYSTTAGRVCFSEPR